MSLILSIDDHPEHHNMLNKILKKMGYTVISAFTGEEGVEMARTGYPDIIILDLKMPDMDGFEVLENLKKNDSTKNIPILILSAVSEKNDILKAKKYDIIGYLTKKLDYNKLQERIEKAINYSKRKRIEVENKKTVTISKHTGRVIVSFKNSLRNENLKKDVNSTFTESFLRSVKDDDLILDLRYLPEFHPDDVNYIHEITGLIRDREVFIVAGRYYGKIMLETEFDERIQTFISFNDMETYSYNK